MSRIACFANKYFNAMAGGVSDAVRQPDWRCTIFSPEASWVTTLKATWSRYAINVMRYSTRDSAD
jgi:hypothetical protein